MTDQPLDQRFADTMGQLLGPDFPSDIGLAVSGGGDSMAMLYLAHNWTRTFGVRLWVVTIDHGLRTESAAEAAMVAEECRVLGWPHATVRWQWDKTGNVQDAARRARLDLVDRWRGAVRHVLFAHTHDDQAETVLMRLARGSGVDGLAGMAMQRDVYRHPLGAPGLTSAEYDGVLPPKEDALPGFAVLRPCLEMTRAELRHYATVLKGRWVEDPTNEDRTYDRVRVRQLLNLLGEEGVTADRLVDTATRMARAQGGLRARLADAVDHVCVDAPLGQVQMRRDAFAALDAETQLRLLSAALRYVSSSEYRPRAASTETLLERLLSGGGGTLHGADICVGSEEFRFMREFAAVRDVTAKAGTLWDAQWVLAADDLSDACVVRALGDDGWRQLSDRDCLPIPHRQALSLPSVWQNDNLVACPMLGVRSDVQANRYVLGRIDTGFKAFCLSH